jgi:4-hydroxy-2-oxoheptanedioate aldolase
MKLRKNKLKQLIQSEEISFGIWNGIPHSYAGEICAGAGFDWVLIDAEHAPFDLDSILVQDQAMSKHDSFTMLRPPSDDSVFIKRVLDLGIDSLLIPMVETAEQAEKIAASIKYPPLGTRGIGSALSRAAQWKRIPDYFEHANENLCLVLQIESVKGMENIDAISKVDGVDGIFVGPADLAGSMGMVGQPMHDDVRAEVKRGLSIIKSNGKAAGTLAVTEDVIKEYIEAGASFIGIGVDLILLAKASEALAQKYKHFKNK